MPPFRSNTKAARRKRGECITCGSKPLAPYSAECVECVENNRRSVGVFSVTASAKHMRDRRQRLRDEEMCQSCAVNAANPGNTLCRGCLLQRKIYAESLRKRRREEFMENCAICLKPIIGRDAKLDHDHKTNRCRGWLCTRCNALIGFSRDSVDILRQAIRYLEKDRTDMPSMTKPYSVIAREEMIARNRPLQG